MKNILLFLLFIFTTSAVAQTVGPAPQDLSALNASNLSSGTVPSARVSGSYTGITGTGTLVAGASGTGFTLNFSTSTLSGTIPNTNLANTATTVNGQTCTLGGTCTAAAAAGTLTGATLAAGVTASSLTSVGTLTNLTMGGFVKLAGTVVSSLPTCNGGSIGYKMYVTDALTPVALAGVTGGGAVVLSVFCNGTIWIVN